MPKNWIITGYISNFISNEESSKLDCEIEGFCKVFSLTYTCLSALSAFVRQKTVTLNTSIKLLDMLIS